MVSVDNARREDSASSASRRVKTRVLIVEDDDEFVGDVRLIASNMHGENIEWVRARGVSEAIALISGDNVAMPDVAVVDVGLADGNGFDFVKRVRDQNLIFPIVVISQNELIDVRYLGLPVSRPTLMDIGANEFKSKTDISGGQIEFISLIISIAKEFDRLFELAERPDRQFHTSISRQALADLRAAARLCRTLPTNLTTNASPVDMPLGMVIFLIEGVASRERLRLDYTLKLSLADRVRVANPVIDSDDPVLDFKQARVPSIGGAIVRMAESIRRLLRMSTKGGGKNRD